MFSRLCSYSGFHFSTPFHSLLILMVFSIYAPATKANESTILVFGDSISAGYGMQAEESWPSLLSARLAATQGMENYKVANASVSGETTGGGLIRLEKTLIEHQPHLLILELGGNDGLRGYPVGRIKENLSAMINIATDRNVNILLVGMVLPPNYGKRYSKAFEGLFNELALEYEIAFIPVLLEGLATSKSLMQRDGIHPKPEAQPMLVENFWPHIEKLLKPE